MARMTECFITVELADSMRKVAYALEAKVPRGRRGFQCPSCHQPVRPAISSTGSLEAYYEHLSKNPNCRLGSS